jgi:carboxymethylenebutenolidase
LPPFLEVFRAYRPPAIATQEVRFASAVRRVTGYLARPDTPERLPAVLLLPGEQGLTDWMRENARDLAGIGYVVLAVDLPRGESPPPARGASAALADERTLAELSAAVRWLRRRADVLPERLGVVGWSRGGEQALALAAATPLQACVACDAVVSDDLGLLAGLRATPVLLVLAGKEENARGALPAFRKALAGAPVPPRVRVYDGVGVGFMRPEDRRGDAPPAVHQAWVEVYEFLGKYVEDAPRGAADQPAPASPPKAAVATIADLMRAVNQPTGVRGTLSRALEQEPATPQQWDRVRANAALMAEAARLLETRTPPRGTRGEWLEQVAALTAAAERIVAAANKHDYCGARHGLAALASRCAACHERHR